MFVKVRLMDMVTVPDSVWRQYGAHASAIHLDFVLADAVSMRLLMVVGLDDKSHRLTETREHDARTDEALTSAGLDAAGWQVLGRIVPGREPWRFLRRLFC